MVRIHIHKDGRGKTKRGMHGDGQLWNVKGSGESYRAARRR